ncbi:MAG: hypothetical protein NT118_06715 [Lentisphaerae bacterium]|nr:hypothetical protein [Lentisphaerota bacterium]
MNSKDITIVRDLARRVAEIAALPVQAEKRRLWKNLNMLKPERPIWRGRLFFSRSSTT